MDKAKFARIFGVCLTAFFMAIPQLAVAQDISIGETQGTYGTSFSATLEAPGTFTGTDFVWSIESGDLPDGLTLDVSVTSKTTTISGTPEKAGSFTFEIKVEDDDSGLDVTEITIEIEKAALTVTAKPKSIIYGDAVPTSGYGETDVTVNGFKFTDSESDLGGSLSFATDYTQGSSVGNSYYIKPSGWTSSNYDITFNDGTLTVGKVALTVEANPQSIAYGDADPTSGYGETDVTVNGFKLTDSESDLGGSLSFATDYTQGSSVSNSYYIRPSGWTSSNYDITFNDGTLTVEKATLTVKANPQSIAYGDADPTSGYGETDVTVNGFKLTDSESDLGGSLSFATDYAQGSTVGSYDITPSGWTSSNYNITFNNGTLTVETKKITEPVLSVPTTFIYDGSQHTVTLNPTSTYYTITGNAQTNAGNYTATVALTDKTNLEWSGGGTIDLSLGWEISKATPACTPSLPGSVDVGKTLDNVSLGSLTVCGSVGGTFAWENPTSTSVLNGLHSYDATFTPTDLTNYETANVKITITGSVPGLVVGSISVNASSVETSYKHGQSLDLSGLKATITYDSGIPPIGCENELSYSAFASCGLTDTHDGDDPLQYSLSTQNVTITVEYTIGSVQGTAPIVITVSEAEITSSAVAVNVTAPALGNAPQATIPLSNNFSGTVSWTPNDSPFEASTVYTANITLNAIANYKFESNSFTFNSAPETGVLGSGNKTLTFSHIFLATGNTPLTPITTAAVTVTAPVIGAVPSNTAGGAGNFAVGTVTWAPNPANFLASTQYTATVTLTANPGYTFTGLATPTINGLAATVTNNTGTAVTLSYPFTTDAATVTGIAVTTQPTKMVYTDGEPLDLTGLVATLTKNDGTAEEVPFASFGTKGITTAPINGATLSTSHNGTTVAVKYSGVTDAQTAALTVTATPTATVTSIAVTTQPTKLSYTDGDPLDLTGLVATLTKNDGTAEDVPLASFGTKGITTDPANSVILSTSHNGTTVAVKYSGVTDAQTAALTVTATPTATVTGIAVTTQPTKLSYTDGDPLDLTGIVATLTKNDGTTEDVLFVDFGIKGITTAPINGATLSTSHNGTTVAVKYSGVTDAQTAALTVTATPIIDVPITIATITVTAPVTGNVPSTAASGAGNFTVSSVSWTPANTIFQAGTQYTVTITLTASSGYTFTGGLATATINGQPATVTNNTGAAATLSYQFPPTTATSLVVTSISIKTEPVKLIYTHGDKLDLSGIVVTLAYSDASTEDVGLAGFAAKNITTNPLNNTTLSNSIHNNMRVEVVYTYNNISIIERTSKLTVHKKVSATIEIGGKALEPDSTGGNEFTFVSPCDKDDIDIDIAQENAEVIVDGDIVQNSLNKELSYGDNPLQITITPQQTGVPQHYKLTVKKPFPAEQMIKMRWGNTLTVIDNSRYNNYEFANYKWYRNGREVGSGRSWSAGANGEKLNPQDKYHLEAATEDGKTIRSCEVAIAATVPKYGILLKNNSASANIGIEVFAPEASDVEIVVYDVGGKQVFKQKGNYAANWDLTDAMQKRVSNGLYFVVAKAKGESGNLYRYSAKLMVKR